MRLGERNRGVREGRDTSSLAAWLVEEGFVYLEIPRDSSVLLGYTVFCRLPNDVLL